MKKLVALVIVFALFIQVSLAVSSDLEDSYAPKETMIGKFSSDILSSISRDQVRLVREGHIDIGFEYDVTKLGDANYIWLIAPQNPGNYTLKVEEVVAFVGGVPSVVDYEKDFVVEGETVNYSINPGFILATDDFTISAIVYGGSSMQISTDFPESREITISHGTNYVSFSLGDLVGVQSIDITLGQYLLPAYLIGPDYICGDGLIHGAEVCDGESLGGNDCTTIEGDYASGTLDCLSNCLSFDVSGCEKPEPEPVCDSDHLDLCVELGECETAGGYWYNETCNQYEEGAECDAEHVGLCETQGTCIDVEGYWYNETCNEEPEPVCGSGHLDLCLTHGTCIDADGYWWGEPEDCNPEPEPVQECGDDLITGNETCDGENLGEMNCTSLGYLSGDLSCAEDCLSFNTSACVLGQTGPPIFAFTPGVIRDTILISEDIQTYSFSVTNNGVGLITAIRFDYDPLRFTIFPDTSFSLDVNETKSFNLTARESIRRPMKAVVVAYSEQTYEYLLLDVNLTSNTSQVNTVYSRNSSGESSYYCSDVPGGIFCDSDEICTSGVSTLDGFCCTGECEGSNGGGGMGWIGYLIIGIVILVLAVIYLKFRKAGPKKGPLVGKPNLGAVKSKRFFLS